MKSKILRCVWVSLVMALALPIVMMEVYVAVHDIEELPDNAVFSELIESGESPEQAIVGSMQKVTGLHRLTYYFEDWYSFKIYLNRVVQYFIILLVATTIVISSDARASRAT